MQCVYDAYHTSVRPMCGFLMRFCRQLLRVLVSSRLVDFRNMSSISVELETHLQLCNYLSWYFTVSQERARGSYTHKGSIVVDWKMNGYCSMKPTCGAVTLRTWGWRKWTLWPVCRSEGQTGTLAAFSESPAAYTHKEKHSIKWLTYDQIHAQIWGLIVLVLTIPTNILQHFT